MDIRNTFLAGKMNLDADTRIIGEGQYREALNIRVANSEGSDVGAIEKSLSNTQLTDLDLGDNVYTLSSLRDEFDEKIYWSVLSDSGCYIIEHEIGNEIDPTKIVLHDSRSGLLNELGFVPDKRLQMVLIVDSDNDNRLLVFTDNNTQPKCINVERAKTYGENGFDEEMILLIKKPPLFAPTIALSTTPDAENNIEDKFLTFFSRYKYLDGEYSALSPASDYPFQAKSFKYDYDTGTNESMLNVFNKVNIDINTGSDLVTDVELVFKESGSNALYLVETFNKADKGWADDILLSSISETIEFINNKIYRLLPEKELYRLYDNVPLLAKALAVINNRIVFGQYTENHDIIDSLDANIAIDLRASLINNFIVAETQTRSIKSNRDYEIGIAYLDDYGRMTTPLTSENNTIHTDNYNSITKNEIKIIIGNNPPKFAKYFRFFIKQNKTDYDTLLPSLFYTDEQYRWIKIEKSDKDKIKEGDYLVVKSDTSSVLTTDVKTKILEIKEQEQNFLQPEDANINEIVNRAGHYFKIKPSRFLINKADYYNYEISTYGSNSTNSSFENVSAITYDPVFYGTTLVDDMVVAPTNTLGNGGYRFKVLIDNLQLAATGTVELTGGASGSVDSITVDGVEIMSGSVGYDVAGLDTTATLIASNITSNLSSPNYTATASGSIITITSVTKGVSVNGFVVVSSATTITRTDTNMSGGAENTFKWNDDNSDVYPNIEIPITAGVSQELRDGVEITFTNDTGHATTDEWNFYAHGVVTGENGVYRRAYAGTRSVVGFDNTLADEGLTTADEVIENGATIDIEYYEAGGLLIAPEIPKFILPETSNDRYENIMEWFYRDGIPTKLQEAADLSGFTGTFDFGRAICMRCKISDTNVYGQKYIYDADGAMTIIFESYTGGGDVDTVKSLDVSIAMTQPKDSRLVFETDPIEENNDIYFEIGQTYPITSDYHIGNGGSDIDQSDGIDAEIILPFYNCYAWGNAVESYKIRDEFNAKSMKIDTRPSTTIENYRQNKRIASFTWSNVYEQTTNYNAINEFNLSLGNYKDLDDKYGSIQRMVSWNTDLDIWQEDKVHKVYYDKKVIYNQDGSSNLAATNDLLQTVVPYTGEYGISTHPESLAVFGNYVYWADAKRGMFLRKGRSGIEVISNFGMRDWTRDAMTSLTTFILGSYDPYFGQYVVSLNGYTLTFDEKVKGWTSFHSWIPSEMERVNNRFFTFKNGQLFLHNATDNGYNYFYNTTPELPYPSRIKTVFNQEAQIDKLFKTIVTESDKAWDVKVVTNLTNSSITTAEFNNRESRWYSYIRQNEDASSLLGVSQGIGRILSLDGNDVDGYDIDFTDISASVSIGDSFIQINGGNQEEVGVISNVVDNTITIDTILITPVVANFCLAKKDSRTNGASVRGYYMEVELEDNSIGNNELFAVTTNVVKSYL